MTSTSNINHIDTLDTPELAPYRTLRRPLEHIQDGIVVVESEKVVRRLLESDLQILSLLLTQYWYDRLFSDLQHRLPPTAQVFIGEKKLLETIVGYNLHQGIMAVARLPGKQSLDEIITDLSEPLLLVALDGLVNAENVGVVVRNCAAFGVSAMIVGETSSSPYLRRAVRNSMGTIFRMPVIHSRDLAASLHGLHEQHQVLIIGADPHERTSMQEVNMAGRVCLVFGNEDAGISSKVLEQCGKRVAIPMMNGTDSLNVASASAVFLYEARRQRGSA